MLTTPQSLRQLIQTDSRISPSNSRGQGGVWHCSPACSQRFQPRLFHRNTHQRSVSSDNKQDCFPLTNHVSLLVFPGRILVPEQIKKSSNWKRNNSVHVESKNSDAPWALFKFPINGNSLEDTQEVVSVVSLNYWSLYSHRCASTTLPGWKSWGKKKKVKHQVRDKSINHLHRNTSKERLYRGR